jgi:hypothetical protein
MAASVRLFFKGAGNAMTAAISPRNEAHIVTGTRKAGLIINPRSGKSNGKGLALAAMLNPTDSVPVKVMESFGQMRPHLEALARDSVTDLFVSSGDGTAQAIITEIAERNPFAVRPRLCFLPHGTTNLSGPDVGFRSRSFVRQAEMLRQLAPRDVVERATVRAVNCGDGLVRHGMFVGTGAVAQATQFCQQAFNAKGVKGSYATFATLASAVGKALFSAPAPDDPTRLDRPYPISIAMQGQQVSEGDQLLIMATTLETLILGTRPFWNKTDGAIRCTTIPYPVPSLLRWTLTVMYGGENRTTPPGCHSFTTGSAEITSQSMFVIDGEFFDPPQGEPLRVETGPTFQFIRG